MQMYSAVLRVFKSQVLQSNGQQYLQSGYLPVQYDRAITFHGGYRATYVSVCLFFACLDSYVSVLLHTERVHCWGLKEVQL